MASEPSGYGRAALVLIAIAVSGAGAVVFLVAGVIF